MGLGRVQVSDHVNLEAVHQTYGLKLEMACDRARQVPCPT